MTQFHGGEKITMADENETVVVSNSESTSILNSVKKSIGIDPTYQQFDTDIVMHINSVFTVLNQLGIGPSTPYSISGATETWSNFFGESPELELVKSYVAMKVRLIFDPPQNGSLLQALKDQIAEFEWRVNVASGV